MQLLLRFLRDYALRHWRWYAVGLVALLTTNWLTVLMPQLIRQTLDALESKQLEIAHHQLILLTLASVALIFIRTVSRLCFFNPGRSAEFNLKNHLFRHLMRLPQSFHDRGRVGDMVSRLTNDLQNVRALIGFAGLQIIEALFVLPMSMYQMVKMDVTITVHVFGLLLLAVLALWYSATRAITYMRRNMEQLAGISDHVLATYSAIPVVQGFCAQGAFSARLMTLNQGYIDNTLQMYRIRTFAMPLVNLLGSMATGVVLWEGGRRVLAEQLTVGVLVAYSGYIGILAARMMSFAWMLSVLQRGHVSLQRVYSLLDTPTGLPEARAALPAPSPGPTSGRGFGFEARGLTFQYENDEGRGATLQDLNFSIAPGETLGIFGRTGSGKSTLIHLLARVYTPPRGTLFLNGVDVCDLPLNDYRDLLALVPQDPFLFSVSIRDNIRFGEKEAVEDSEDRVKWACSKACIDNDLQAFAQGLDTVVGARGITLSGGQRQRVALARAFYRPFSILLLDDVLAAVDHQTERRLIENIYTREPGQGTLQTTVIISHRISALKHADRILVLEGGRLVDQGRHEELIARDGSYAEVWKSQQDEGEVENG
jgi:ATP-binding cassette subfamily B protein